jgi:hypothetical protein
MRFNILAAGPASRQALILGSVVATATWLWVALIDAAAGQPFHTFDVLGGIAAFTIVHYGLNIAYALAIVGVARAAAGAPSVIIGAIFVFIILEVGFGMVSALLSQMGLGNRSWILIFGGSLVGAAIALSIVAKPYQLAARLGEAEAER